MSQCMHAGESVIQFATAADGNSTGANGRSGSRCYIIKCFPTQDAQDRERSLYADGAFKEVLPKVVLRSNLCEGVAGGILLPPLLVTEGGDNLETVFASCRPNLFRVVEVWIDFFLSFHLLAYLEQHLPLFIACLL
jgi:hypothetical protein